MRPLKNPNDRKRVNRVGRCIEMTAVTEGPYKVEEYADEYFEAALLISTAILEFWDLKVQIEALLDDPNVEKYLNNDKTLQD